MLHNVPQNLTREFCYFLKITNKQQNRHAKLIVQVVMQSMDEAGNISWSSLILVTSSFPAHGETTWDLYCFMGEGLKRNSPKQAQHPSVYIGPVFPIFSVGLTEIQLLPTVPASRHPHTGASRSSWQLTEHTEWVTVLWCEVHCYKFCYRLEGFGLKRKQQKSDFKLFTFLQEELALQHRQQCCYRLWAPAGTPNCTTLSRTAEASGAEPTHVRGYSGDSYRAQMEKFPSLWYLQLVRATIPRPWNTVNLTHSR